MKQKIKRLKEMPSDKAQLNSLSNIKVVKNTFGSSSKELKEENDSPLKRFKGTKWNVDDRIRTERKDKSQNKKYVGVVDFTEESDSMSTKNSKLNGDDRIRTERKGKSQNTKHVGVVDFTEESETKTNKNQNHESYNFMSKLEQFSDVWNDCPSVRNPKENVESWYSRNSKPQNDYKTEENFNESYRKTKSKNEYDGNRYNTTFSINVRDTREKRVTNVQRPENEKNKATIIVNENSKVYPPNVQDTENHDSNISDLKRKKAVQEHNKLHIEQKNMIKQALSSLDGKSRPNKKIVFEDAEDNVQGKIENGVVPEVKDLLRQKLFEDDDSDVETDFKLNPQFKGRKGQKLLELQSKFASDSRFALDTRFYESGSDEEEGESVNKTAENVDLEEEKRKQLEILESIVKQPIKPLSEMKWKKPMFTDETYLRFDPTREDHKKYIITQPDRRNKEEENSEKKKKKKNKSEPEATAVVKVNKTKVTTDKFVAVKEDLKEALKKDDGAEFSLLKLFGPKESDKSSAKADQSQTPRKLKYGTKNPFKYDSSDSEPEEEKSAASKKKKSAAAAQTQASWRTTFFLTENDPRLQEAFEFLKGPEEEENNKEYAQKRKVLKDFIRHKFKNNNRKRTLFKKKLGGFKRKPFQKNKGKLS